MAKEKKNKCLCGCGKTAKGLFAQGHDMKLRSKVMRAYYSDEKAPKLTAAQRDYLKSAHWVDKDVRTYLKLRGR